MSQDSTINTVELDDRSIVKRHADIEHERAMAVRDLLERGRLQFNDSEPLQGPYHLKIGLRSRRLILLIRNFTKSNERELSLSLSPYRRLIKDYFILCEGYAGAFKVQDSMQLETLDMARRSLHDEGADILRERLKRDLTLDHETARGLFTLICILHIGAVRPW